MFSTPLGLLALAGVPLVVALHLFQRRFQPREVSALFLWGRADTHSPSGRTRQPLVRSASFWFELLAAICLGLALGGPRAGCASTTPHLVVVLDSSASMGALDPKAAPDSGHGLDERARALVDERIADLGPSGLVTIVASGARPGLVAGPAVTRVEARRALADWSPGRGRHDLAPAVSLARDFAGEGAVLLVTDRYTPDAWPEEVELAALGRPLGNLALVGASRVATSAGERLSVTIANLSGGDRMARLSVSTTTRPRLELFRESVVVPAGGRERVRLELPPDSPPVMASLDDDELAMDNVAWLAPAPRRELALHSPLEPELRQALGLESLGGERPFDRWLALTPSSRLVDSPEGADLVIAGATPEGTARPWTLAIEAPGEERHELLGPFLKDLREPTLAGLTLDGIVWSHAPGHRPPGEPLVTVGDAVLLSRSDDGPQRTWHLSLDPGRSTLQRSPDWPILLSNLAEERRRALPGPERTNLRTGETLRFSADAPGRYRLTGPLHDESVERELSGGRVLLVEMPPRAGLYRLELLPAATAEDATEDATGDAETDAEAADAPPAAGLEVALLAVNLVDAAESDLSGLSSGTREALVSLAETDTRAAWLETLLACLALGLVLADGFVLGGHRLRRELTPGELHDPEGAR